MRRAAALVGIAALALPAAGAAFTPNDPLAPRQWYLAQDHAFDFWPAAPSLEPVKVAVIDSGIDGGHPEFVGRIAAWRSFVGGSPLTDQQGHGTFVAGEIAAASDNAAGIAGMAPSAQLVIAKVVTPDGSVSLQAEVEAIHWAVDEGAKVVNLSLGGVRDPLNPKLDTYSPLEQAAVQYAYAHGAVVVAAVGNGPQSPSTPWPFAHYPAALPHVIGVSAITESGDVPDFSNRDAIYNDIAAPGQDILSTLPRAITALRPTCVDQGYSDCGTPEFRLAEGTSFAAPQVSAAAALVLGVRPDLSPDQVTALLEHTADDANATNGCKSCPLLRDSFTGWGHLDVLKALQALSGPLPVADAYEANDDAGPWARKLYGSRGKTIHATLDFWDDDVDVYAVLVRKGQKLYAHLNGPARADSDLLLWRPGTQRVTGLQVPFRSLATRSARLGSQERVAYRATTTGWYFIEVKLTTPGSGPYTLSYVKAS